MSGIRKSTKTMQELLKQNFLMKIMRLKLLWLIQQQTAEKS